MARTLDGFGWYPPEEDWFDEPSSLSAVLGDALHDCYADAEPEELEEALDNVMDAMSAAEALSVTSALKQIGRASGQVLGDPAVARIAGTALPMGGSALGTVIGGPAGTAIGGGLGQAAAKALAGPARALSSPAAAAGGSAAAVQAMVLQELGPVREALLRLALGEHGQRSVNGIPVAQLMRTLSSVFGQAAADADELNYLDGDGDDMEAIDSDGAFDGDRWLYTALVDAANEELEER